ncbi:MAG: NAD(P)-binding domain-containing protein, partial [Geminicoccaceae bacterium]
MATHMVKAGIDLRGFDLNQAAMQSLADAGGVAALSCKDAARGQSLLHVVVAKAEQAEMVLFGDDGAVAELADGATVVLHSTVPPAFARRLGARLAETGHPFLDAPISGGR